MNAMIGRTVLRFHRNEDHPSRVEVLETTLPNGEQQPLRRISARNESSARLEVRALLDLDGTLRVWIFNANEARE